MIDKGVHNFRVILQILIFRSEQPKQSHISFVSLWTLGVCCLLWSGVNTSLTPSVKWPGARGQLTELTVMSSGSTCSEPHLARGGKTWQSGVTFTSPGVTHAQRTSWHTADATVAFCSPSGFDTFFVYVFVFILSIYPRLGLNCCWHAKEPPRAEPMPLLSPRKRL